MSTTSAFIAASKGAVVLDQKRPGWVEDINLDRLNMASIDECIVGQLFGDYYTGRNNMGLNMGESGELGYSTDTNDLFTYDELDEAWRSIVTARRIGSVPVPPEVTVPQTFTENDVLAAILREREQWDTDVHSSVVFRILERLGVVVE